MTAIATRLRARRTSGGPARTYRLANSVVLPFGIGLASLLVVALGTGLLVGRVDEADLAVPGAVRQLQANVAGEVAESIRRGVNEGIDDVEQLAAEIERTPDVALALAFESFTATHGRYQSAYLLDANRQILAQAGVPPNLDLLHEAALDEVGMHVVLESDTLLLAQIAPVPGKSGRSVVAHYDPQFLRFAMAVAAPGDAWLVDGEKRIIAGLGAASPGTQLPSPGLDDAAEKATAGKSDGVATAVGGVASADVVAWEPVRGRGVAGDLGWGVVTAQRVDAAGLGTTGARSRAITLSLALAVTALAAFAWMRAVILRPVLAMQREAERLAYGDLSVPVQAVRYDEIGMIARALERVRVMLIRNRMRTR